MSFTNYFVFTLLRFGKVLDGYAAAESFEALLKSAKEVNRCGTLLWHIGYSRILENHLKVLHTKKLLMLPANSQEDLDKFFNFTDFARITKNQVIAQLTDDEDQEYRAIADKTVSSDNHDLYTAFLEGIRLQVDGFQAARKITSFMKHTRTPRIDLTLPAVRRTKPKPAQIQRRNIHVQRHSTLRGRSGSYRQIPGRRGMW